MTSRDVRWRLLKVGYDGIRVEYHDGGAVEYVAFSNRNITPVSEGVNVNSVVDKNALLSESRNYSPCATT